MPVSRSRSGFPIVDLFAGPGGLGEGFASYERRDGSRPFRIAISIEKNPEAHSTLELRSFYRRYEPAAVPEDYYRHLRGELSRADLFRRHEKAALAAREDAWLCELGSVREDEVDRRVASAIGGRDQWVLIGGPPCQAYSLVGRARMRSADPEKFERDPRHFLYREYLRIIARHRPPVFVMENVKGLLSATHDGSNMFERILEDLREPPRVSRGEGPRRLRYSLHALSAPKQSVLRGDAHPSPDDFVLRAEEHGIPQARHRIIIVGVRDDLLERPAFLPTDPHRIALRRVIFDLPRLRSQISGGHDSADAWKQAVAECAAVLRNMSTNDDLSRFLGEFRLPARNTLPTGAAFIASEKLPTYRADWYVDPRLGGICNHVSRSHLRQDIQRYFFAAAFAASMNGTARSPRLADFPEFLLPNHRNVQDAIEGRMFSDRFRVQIASAPSTTITSHISKDGHYYIHPDPAQARSLTVREAARLQTFPDNYVFCGSRTSQYQQVGNAVPPLLAAKIAAVVDGLLNGR